MNVSDPSAEHPPLLPHTAGPPGPCHDRAVSASSRSAPTRWRTLRVGEDPGGSEPAHEWREQVRRRVYGETERFDRIAFARRALDTLRPPRLSVLLRHGFRELRVEQGERWDRPGQSWVCLAIPANASREEIVLALMACAGVQDDPYWFDVLLRLPPEG